MAYTLVKCLPAGMLLGMNVIYYSQLSKQDYILFLLCMGIHFTFLQVAGGWLGSAQSFYFANEGSGRSTLTFSGRAGMRANTLLWLPEFVILLIIVKSPIAAALTVGLTFLQTSMQVAYTRMQLANAIKKQIKLTVLYCLMMAGLAAALVFTHSSSVEALLAIQIAAVFFALVWYSRTIEQPSADLNSVTKSQLISLVRYAIPMGLWFFLFATNSYFDRYLIGVAYPNLNPKDYLLTKELTQGVLSLLTAPFIMVAHVKIFTAYRAANYEGAEKNIEKYASSMLFVGLVSMPIIDSCFGFFIRILVNPLYVHDHISFLSNYLSILVMCIGLYIQKGLEVSGRSASMVIAIFSVLMVQVFLHYFLNDTRGLVKFALVNLIGSFIYIGIVNHMSRKILKFNIIFPVGFWLMAGFLALYSVAHIPSSIYMVDVATLFWSGWVICFILASLVCVKKLVGAWAV